MWCLFLETIRGRKRVTPSATFGCWQPFYAVESVGKMQHSCVEQRRWEQDPGATIGNRFLVSHSLLNYPLTCYGFRTLEVAWQILKDGLFIFVHVCPRTLEHDLKQMRLQANEDGMLAGQKNSRLSKWITSTSAAREHAGLQDPAKLKSLILYVTDRIWCYSRNLMKSLEYIRNH